MTHRQSGLEMPNDLIFIRHGESEANVVQRAEKMGEVAPMRQEIASRPDWQQRLTKKGIKQAMLVRDWLDFEVGGADSFDGLFVSPFLRARETASCLGGDAWVIDDRTIERFRGGFGVAYYDALDLATIKASPWYARVGGEESLQDVFSRYRTFQNSLRRNHAGQRVLIVTHGDFIKAACYAIEWLLPEHWAEEEFKNQFRLPNCGLIHYSRVNPYNPSEISKSIRWRRIIFPNDLKSSPHDGAWVELKIKRSFSAKELGDDLENYPALLKDSQNNLI